MRFVPGRLFRAQRSCSMQQLCGGSIRCLIWSHAVILLRELPGRSVRQSFSGFRVRELPPRDLSIDAGCF